MAHSFESYTFIHLTNDIVFVSVDRMTREKMNRMDKNMLTPWAEVAALKEQAAELCKVQEQGTA
jgi:hypothetical protein